MILKVTTQISSQLLRHFQTPSENPLHSPSQTHIICPLTCPNTCPITHAPYQGQFRASAFLPPLYATSLSPLRSHPHPTHWPLYSSPAISATNPELLAPMSRQTPPLILGPIGTLATNSLHRRSSSRCQHSRPSAWPTF